MNREYAARHRSRSAVGNTTLFVIDTGLDLGAAQDPPNAGALNTFQALGADAGDLLSFDISTTQVLIASAPSAGAPSRLFDVANGARRNLGQVGSGETVRALAISLGRFGMGSGCGTRRRENASPCPSSS